jgi:hypothetical protein
MSEPQPCTLRDGPPPAGNLLLHAGPRYGRSPPSLSHTRTWARLLPSPVHLDRRPPAGNPLPHGVYAQSLPLPSFTSAKCPAGPRFSRVSTGPASSGRTPSRSRPSRGRKKWRAGPLCEAELMLELPSSSLAVLQSSLRFRASPPHVRQIRQERLLRSQLPQRSE